MSAVDTTNTVTPVASKLRASYAAIDTAATFIRGVTVAGAAAGMTGGTLSKDTAPLMQLGQFLLAAGQNSHDIRSFRIDPTTGKLTPTEQRWKVGSPVCLRFVPLK
jgi:hypothetical protein